ncbi:unnamed protein product [Phytophthora lilii]|uniref:Unnamed protein product n=1 Tax=Phytophthora lilii TaxID=2077276 RepID=A0A9W6X1H3_9STRA|nr:unnamed protein product [Phytophthora lilii]
MLSTSSLQNTDTAGAKAKIPEFTQKMLVRFVQLTRSTTHSFQASFFEDFLTRLKSCRINAAWIYAVEVSFVVLIAIMDQFRPPASVDDFKREALTAFVGLTEYFCASARVR